MNEKISDNRQIITNITSKRIGSIDALRAFALLGIILVHAHEGFAYIVNYSSKMDFMMKEFIEFFFSNRCAIIFNVLFGVSFFLILRKDGYSSKKFVWRCFLLMLVGLLNKIFYLADALVWYGICDMLVVPIRRIQTKYVFFVSILFFVITSFLVTLNLGKLIPKNYYENLYYYPYPSLRQILFWWPKAIFMYFKIIFDRGIFNTMGFITLGYWLGRLGVVEKIDKIVNIKYVICGFLLYVFGIYIHIHLNCCEYYVSLFWKISGAYFYSVLFIYMYNHIQFLSPIFNCMEKYGKLGLTNYTFQGVFAAVFLCYYGFGFTDLSTSHFVLYCFLFYIIQTIFSVVWLSFFRNGPLEWLWRCATSMKILPILKR